MFRKSLLQTFIIRRMSIFTQNINPITGVMAWEEKDPDYDYYQEIARSSFADMLHDTERNKKYYAALKAAIHKKHAAGEEANVLDIGTGTGLLSMMAAKCGADSVVACEAFKPIAECARKIIKKNGYADKIKVVYKRSTKLSVGENGDLLKKANILVAEVFDTELIGEGALSTFKHAAEYLLEENSIIVPSRGTVYGQIIESPLVRSWNRVDSIVNPADQKILLSSPKGIENCSGASAVHDVQLSQLPEQSFTPLISATPIFTFDWSNRIPLKFNENITLTLKPTVSGVAHAVFFWWDLDMDTEDQIKLSCAPVWEHPDIQNHLKNGKSLKELSYKIPWRDHWMQAIYYFPEDNFIFSNNEVYLSASHDEYSFWFSLSNVISNNIEKFRRPQCECYSHIAYSRNRIGQRNDDLKNKKYLNTILNKINSESICVCLSDGSLIGLSIANLVKKLYILETNSLSKKSMEKFIDENTLSNVVMIEEICDLPKSDEIDFVFGEPYYITSILPWDNLRFWYLISRYPKHIDRLPMHAMIRGVAVDFKDLHKIRAPLGIREGFDLTIFDELVESSSKKTDALVEAQPLWEYPGCALSRPFEITRFDFFDNPYEKSKIDITLNIPFEMEGICSGIALWIDWYIENDVIISSGPTREIEIGNEISWYCNTKQGVHLLQNTKEVNKQNTLTTHLKLNPVEGDLHFHFDIL